MFIENIQSTEILNNITSKYADAMIENNIVKKYTSIEEEYDALKQGSGIYINHDPVIIGLEGNHNIIYKNLCCIKLRFDNDSRSTIGFFFNSNSWR